MNTVLTRTVNRLRNAPSDADFDMISKPMKNEVTAEIEICVSAQLSSETAEALRVEAFSGLKALPRRGAEIGGILTQTTGTSSIDGLEFIPSEHLYGPGYRLSALDREVFREKCREFEEAGKRRIAGFFRSATGDSFNSAHDTYQVTQEDLSLVRELMPNATSLVLIKPYLSGNATFRLYRREESRDWTMTEEFEVRHMWTPAPVAVHAEATVRVDGDLPSAPVYASPAPPPVRRVQLERRLAIGVMAFLAVLGVLALTTTSVLVSRGWWKAAPQSTMPSGQELGMQVAPQGDTLRLVWNRSLRSVRESDGGNLEIHDGGWDRTIFLDKSQVAQAVIYYKPESDDVTFRLTIRGPDAKPVNGIARILVHGKESAAAPHAAVVEPERQTPVGNLAKSELKPPAQARVPKERVVRPARRTDLRAVPVNQPEEAAAQNAGIGAPAQNDSTATERVRPESVPEAAAADVETQALGARIPAPAPANNPLTAIPDDVPVSGHPIFKAMPARSSYSAHPIGAPVTVRVEVTIDQQGRVVQARALSNASSFWAVKSVEAARQWRYSPATLRGKGIPSVSTIDFHFNPQ